MSHSQVALEVATVTRGHCSSDSMKKRPLDVVETDAEESASNDSDLKKARTV